MLRTLLLVVAVWVGAETLSAAQAEGDSRYEEAYGTLFMSPGEVRDDLSVETARRGVFLLQELAEEGHANALNTLGLIYRFGLFGVSADRPSAVRLYEQAYERADRDIKGIVAYNLASTLSEAAPFGSQEWIRIEALASEAASYEDVEAAGRSLVGKAMVMGPGEGRYKLALSFLLDGLSAEAPDNSLHWLIARGYSSGWFGEASPEAACPHFRAAAQAGMSSAYWQTGMCFLNGEGVPRESEAAFRWVRLSAESGDPRGMISSAVMLATGDGVAEDDFAAAEWYRRAILAESDSRPHAMRGLGAMHYVGELLESSDTVLGRALLELAAEGGDDQAPLILAQYGTDYAERDRLEVETIKADPVAFLSSPQAE